MLAATETTKDSILSIIITPFQKRQVLGSERIIAQNLRSEQYFRRCVCVFLVQFWCGGFAWYGGSFFVLWKGIYIFALRPGVLYFLHAAAWRRKYSNPYAEFESDGFCRRGIDTIILNFKVAVSAGSGFMLLFCVRVYCIFSTLPLDVENTVTRTQSLKVMTFCVLERNREKRTKRAKRVKK